MKRFLRLAAFRFKGHIGTLEQLFIERPAKEQPPTIHWRSVKKLLTDCGVDIRRGPDDGTYLELNDISTEIQTPQGEVLPPTIRIIRTFLENAGVTPASIRLFLAGKGATT